MAGSNKRVLISRRKKKIKEVVAHALVHIYATFNNTIVTLTRLNGETLSWTSGGTIGYKGSKKSTPYAAQVATNRVLGIAKQYGVQSLEIKVKGIGPGRNSALRTLQSGEIKMISISDFTPIAHNGCRPPKRPRG